MREVRLALWCVRGVGSAPSSVNTRTGLAGSRSSPRRTNWLALGGEWSSQLPMYLVKRTYNVGGAGRCQATLGHRLSRDGQAGVLSSSTASAAVTPDAGVGAGATWRGSGTTSRPVAKGPAGRRHPVVINDPLPSVPGPTGTAASALQAPPGVTPGPTGQATPVPTGMPLCDP